MHWSCRVFASLALALFVGLSSPIDRAYAQAADEKAQVIQEVVDLYKEERFLQRLLDAAVRAAPPEKQQDYQALVSKVDQDRIYAELAESVNELYTTEELKAYLEFASTDVGRSMLRKKTQMSEKLYEAVALELLDAATK